MAKQNTATVPAPNALQRGREFVQDVKSETDKVVWPNQQDLKASTTVVIIFLGIMAAMIGVMDVVFQRFILMLLNIF